MDTIQYFGDNGCINTWIDPYSLYTMLRCAGKNITLLLSQCIRTISNLHMSFFSFVFPLALAKALWIIQDNNKLP